MLNTIRCKIIQELWKNYISDFPCYSSIFPVTPPLDHFAIIDLTSNHTGKNTLKKIFECIGFVERGSGYLPEKQNDFLWMAEEAFEQKKFLASLPQIVFADFRNELLSSESQKIITSLTKDTKTFDYELLKHSILQLDEKKPETLSIVVEQIINHLSSKAWRTPTKAEYEVLNKENSLIAWVALFGRKVNHFGFCINGLSQYKNLEEFISELKSNNPFKINNIAGEIKGGRYQGISQASSIGSEIYVQLEDGEVKTNSSFMEFVWRYPKTESPKLWSDYFNGFIADNATHVIESLYKKAL